MKFNRFYDEKCDATSSKNKPHWPTPAYEGMIGNVLPEFLSFSGHPFPEPPSTPHQPFPTLTETHHYLQKFAEPFLKSGVIKLNREVVRVEELSGKGGWRVITRDWNAGGREEDELWDAVVVAVGWHDNPVWPETEGLDELRNRGLAKHAKSWQGPDEYVDKVFNTSYVLYPVLKNVQKALVVGNANSSNDIAAQLAPISNGPVYQSIRRPAFPGFVSLPDERITMVPSVSNYTLKISPDGAKFDALLSDGTLLVDLDTVQVGSGYKILPSFIHVFNEAEKMLLQLVTNDTKPHRVPSLHRLILYAFNPSLAFVGAPMSYTPFTIADVVSTWLALAWSGETPYPNTVDGRLAYEKERMAAIDKWRNEIQNPSSLMVYNVLGQGEQEYAKALKEDIVKARPELDAVLPEWSDRRTALREAMHRTKFEALKFAREHGVSEVQG